MFVTVCTPFGAVASPAHQRSLAIAQSNALSHTFMTAEIDLHIVSKARVDLLTVLPPQCDVAWFVDSDVLLPPNAATLLDYIEENPVVSGLYFARQPPHFPQVYNRAAPGFTTFAYLPIITIPVEPTHYDAVGAGCLAIRTDVIKEMASAHEAWKERVKEWANEPTNEQLPSEVRRAVELGLSLNAHFEFLNVVGEDFWFCEQLYHYLNIRPLLVPSVECGHETSVAIGRGHFVEQLKAGVNFQQEAIRKEAATICK